MQATHLATALCLTLSCASLAPVQAAQPGLWDTYAELKTKRWVDLTTRL
ncbi:hypothetical protein [Pseudomonas oryzihabitans]|uniref:Uncharacterized protein n=1 Tax=Pseudomonas oryzihabitans TaxID=47885 RepID=A0AAJ2BKF7_9PSED|nr:hypothetical protein [Pseudomonas psychrotolerans]MDR6232896.1 hypothetical protein [Pseudomonas psychrotolerans]